MEDLVTQTIKTPMSLQEAYAPQGTCFGCGPSNNKGLQVRSFVRDSVVVADWIAASHHEAFPGVLNGGIIGAILDCHSNWTAAHHLMKRDKLDHPPCTVTSEYAVKLTRPTPSKVPVHLSATVVASDGNSVTVETTLQSGEKICATCRGVFVAVKPGHPAYHRWGVRQISES